MNQARILKLTGAAVAALCILTATAATASASGTRKPLGTYKVVSGSLVQGVDYRVFAKQATVDGCFFAVDNDIGSARADYKADAGQKLKFVQVNGVVESSEIAFSGTIAREFTRNERYEAGPEADSYACEGAEPPDRPPPNASFCGSHRVAHDRAISLDDIATQGGQLGLAVGPLVSDGNDPFNFACPSDVNWSTLVLPSPNERGKPNFATDRRITLAGEAKDASADPINWPGPVAHDGNQRSSIKWKLVLERVRN